MIDFCARIQEQREDFDIRVVLGSVHECRFAEMS